jgi:DNA-binding beta-propeller fold protein YncE
MLAAGVALAADAPAGASTIEQLPRPLGCLTPGGTGGCGDSGPLLGARAIAIAPDGRTAYVAQPGSDGVVAFDADPATGALTRRPGTITGNGISNPFSVAVSGDGRWVAVGSAGTQMQASDVPAPNAGVSLFRRDPASGALSPGGCIAQGGGNGCADGHGLGGVVGVEISGDGTDVYAASWVGGDAQRGHLAVLRRSGGALTQSAGGAGCLATNGADGCRSARALRGPTAIALAPDGEHLYVATWIDESVAAFDRKPADGSLAQAGCVAAPSRAGALSCAAVDFLDNPGDDGDPSSQPAGIAFAGNARLYVAERRGRTIGALDRNPASGALRRRPGRAGCVTSQAALAGVCTPARSVSAADAPQAGSLFETQGVAAHGDVLVAGTLGNTAVTSYAIGVGGGLTPVAGPRGCIAAGRASSCTAGAGFAGGLAPVDLALSPDGRFAYAAMMRPFDALAGGGIMAFRVGGGAGAGGAGGGSSAIPRVTAKVRPVWRKRRSHVVLRRLRVVEVPPDASVEVRCAGRRCPFKRKRFAVRMGRVDASKAFRRGRLRAAAKLQVRITRPGAIGKVVIYAVRRKGLPKGAVRCLPPGAATPERC